MDSAARLINNMGELPPQRATRIAGADTGPSQGHDRSVVTARLIREQLGRLSPPPRQRRMASAPDCSRQIAVTNTVAPGQTI
jgi:hypothetical protein